MTKKFGTVTRWPRSDNPKAALQTEIQKRPRRPKRLRFLALVITSIGLAAWVEAQQPKKVARIGYLSSGNPTSESARAEGIRLALRERGYIEGQNITIDYRYAEATPDRLPRSLGRAGAS